MKESLNDGPSDMTENGNMSGMVDHDSMQSAHIYSIQHIREKKNSNGVILWKDTSSAYN